MSMMKIRARWTFLDGGMVSYGNWTRMPSLIRLGIGLAGDIEWSEQASSRGPHIAVQYEDHRVIFLNWEIACPYRQIEDAVRHLTSRLVHPHDSVPCNERADISMPIAHTQQPFVHAGDFVEWNTCHMVILFRRGLTVAKLLRTISQEMHYYFLSTEAVQMLGAA